MLIQQAEDFIKHVQQEKLPCKILVHDNDGKYSKPFLKVITTCQNSTLAKRCYCSKRKAILT